MDDSINTAHFIIGEVEPETPVQKAMMDIVRLVEIRLSLALKDQSTQLCDTHPRVIISMIITNILVNLMNHHISARDIHKRRLMVNEILQEISDMTRELWNSLEANAADMSIQH